MNLHGQDRLLESIFDSENKAARLREISLSNGLSFVKRGQRRRKIASAAGTIAGAVLAAGAVLFYRGASVAPSRAKIAALVTVAAKRAGTQPVDVKNITSINADELFALLPHRTLALIGRPGHQQLICLDSSTRAPENLAEQPQ